MPIVLIGESLLCRSTVTDEYIPRGKRFHTARVPGMATSATGFWVRQLTK